MITGKDIAAALAETYNGSPWYGPSITDKLKQVDNNTAQQRFAEGRKNIAEYISHIIAWRTFVIERLSANFGYKVGINSERDWPTINTLSEDDWGNLLAELDNTQQKLIELLNSMDNNLMNTPMPNTGDYSFTYLNMLQGIYQHDVYHLGQVAMTLTLLTTE